MKTASPWHAFREKAAKSPRKIILADGEDPRIIQAAVQATEQKIAHPVLIGNTQKIAALWQRHSSVPLPEIIDNTRLMPDQQERYFKTLCTLSKFKTLPAAEINLRLTDPLVLGCLATKLHEVEGFIGGATRTTADTLRAAFSIIGLKHGISTLFGFFLIEKREPVDPQNALALLADCAVIPDPSAKQLSQIGIYGAQAFSFFTQQMAKIAFLSFSTHGSAEHESVTKIREALTLAKAKAPTLMMDGEWQADAALDAFTAGIKGVATSPMAGQANVLVVPDLNCGNIAYKLVQRLGGCRAVGPVLWGLNQPANDLSRGCTWEDVLDMIALTGIQAQAASAGVDSDIQMKAQVS